MESQFAEQIEGRSSLCKGLYQTKDETMVTKKVQLGQGVNATKCDPTFVCVCVCKTSGTLLAVVLMQVFLRQATHVLACRPTAKHVGR